jgi:hypothetical protein
MRRRVKDLMRCLEEHGSSSPKHQKVGSNFFPLGPLYFKSTYRKNPVSAFLFNGKFITLLSHFCRWVVVKD